MMQNIRYAYAVVSSVSYNLALRHSGGGLDYAFGKTAALESEN